MAGPIAVIVAMEAELKHLFARAPVVRESQDGIWQDRWVEIGGVLILLVNFCALLFLTAFTDEANAPHFSPATVFTLTSVMTFALVGVTLWEGARIAIVSIVFYYIVRAVVTAYQAARRRRAQQPRAAPRTDRRR